MENPNLKKNILATVAYYDALNFPLTAFEIWKYLTVSHADNQGENRAELGAVLALLGSGEMARWIDSDRGLFFLRGRQKLVRLRIKRNKVAASKIKRLQRVVYWMRLIPFVRMVAVTGRLAMKNAERKSDWDLLIAIQKGRIWTGRTLVTAFAEIIGKRRKANLIRNRLCLNYFLSDGNLEIKHKDLFSANEYSFIFPLWGAGTFRRFREANRWIEGYKPDFRSEAEENIQTIGDNFLVRSIQKLGELLLGWDFIEKHLRHWEKEKIMANPLTHKEGSLIEADDDALVFLPEPQGPKVFERFRSRIDNLLIHNRTAL